MTDIQPLIERLLGRKVNKDEGVDPKEITEIETQLGFSLPENLRNLYLLVGQNAMLLESFNRFALPNQLLLEEGKVLFLEENQEMCYWAFEAGENNPKVHQLINKSEWRTEKISLNEFLSVMLYYQCAMGGYEFYGVSQITNEDLEIFINTEFEEVVNYNGLCIYWKQDCLLWYVYDENNKRLDDLYFSARTQEVYNAHVKKYELEDI